MFYVGHLFTECGASTMPAPKALRARYSRDSQITTPENQGRKKKRPSSNNKIVHS